MADTKLSKTEEMELSAALAEELSKLRDDVASLTRVLREGASAEVDRARKQATETGAHLRDEGVRRLHEADKALHDAGDQAVEAIRRQPAAAVGLAVAIGFVVGLLAGRK